MAVVYNANEICTMGIQIEKNGKKFYITAADKTGDEDLRKFFTELANWEDNHISIFENLRNDFLKTENGESAIDPDNEMHLYLKAAADSHIFLKKIDIDELVARCNNPLDILDIALQFEKDSVVLYNTMINMVPKNLGKKQVLKEET